LTILKQLNPKSFSIIIYATTFVLVGVMFSAAYSYKKSVYWENKYNEKLSDDSKNYETLKHVSLLLSNADLENDFLLTDYFSIDSMLFSERLLNSDLNKNLLEKTFHYRKLLETNKDLLNKIGFYEDKINQLLTELQYTQNQLTEAIQIAEFLKNNILEETIENSGDVFTVEFLTQYKLISLSSSAISKGKSGEKPTKKIKNTDHIKITINTIQNLNFDFGNKTIFIRIADPNGTILPFTKDEVDLFKFQGDEILFSEKDNVVFSAKKLPINIIYHPVTKLSPGVYWVYAFCDGIRLGETSFDLN